MPKLTFLEWLADELKSGRTNIDSAEYYALGEHKPEIEIGFDEDETIADLTRVKDDG